MDPAQFFAASRVAIVAGKGGVGKTTVSAAMARAAARSGLSTLIIEIEGRSGLAEMFGQPALGYEEAVLAPGGGPDGAGDIRARTLTADEALIEYLEDHGLSRVARRLARSGALDVVATAAPGIKDILLLGKVKQLERDRAADLIVVDAPAAGHAIGFLGAARTLLDSVNVGPIHTQARDVMELLADASRSQVVLVTLPEETPVNELIETVANLEDRVGVSLAPLIVNGLYSDVAGLEVEPERAATEAGTALRPGEADTLAAAADFRRHRIGLQRTQTHRLASSVDLDQIHLPFLFTTEIGVGEIDTLAEALGAARTAAAP